MYDIQTAQTIITRATTRNLTEVTPNELMSGLLSEYISVAAGCRWFKYYNLNE